jgi:GntR family transcriptional regulator
MAILSSMSAPTVKVPRYYAVKTQIAELIDGAPPGTAIPTERELAVRFDTSRTTVRQALSELVVDGRLERTQGRGTFVAEPKVVQVRQLTSYSDDLRQQGKNPTSTVLSVTREAASDAVAAHLDLQPGDVVHRVERLCGVAGEPLAHEVAWLPGPLARLRQELERRGSLYQTMREAYGMTLSRAEDTVETALAGPLDAQLLAVDVGLPMLLIHRTGFDAAGRPVEWTRSVFRGDRFRFVAVSALDA